LSPPRGHVRHGHSGPLCRWHHSGWPNRHHCLRIGHPHVRTRST
jgi:hypothetical protein